MSDDAAADASRAGIDYRQVSLVAVAAVALVLAAFVAPAIVGPDDPDDPSNGVDSPGDNGDAGDGTGPSFDWSDFLEWLDWGEESAGEPAARDPVCTIQLHADPTPGDEVTATVRYEREPVTNARVWFNDRGVGVTDGRGQVTGTVPYSEELLIRVDTDDEGECRAATETVEGPGATIEPSAYGYENSPRVDPPSETPSSEPTLATAGNTGALQPNESSNATESTNATATYEVDGAVSIAVDGVPDPGAPLELEADIDGVPMAAADVTVDGERVTETDPNGKATVTVPDDGTDRLELAVARGDFEGSTTLDVRLLDATVLADGIAPVPGSDGTVVAELGDDVPRDATVAVDGDRRATTEVDGTAPITLPIDPRTTVTVSTDDQTARTTLVDVYGGPAVAVFLLVTATAGVAYRTHGRRGPTLVLGLTAIALAALVVEAFYGPTGGLATLGLGLAAALGFTLSRSSRRLSPGRPSVGDAYGRAIEWLVARALVVVGVLEAVVDRLRAAGRGVATWLGSVPRSVTGLVRRLAAWIGALPRRTVAGCRRGLAALGGRPGLVLAGSVGIACFVLVGYVVGEGVGAALATVAIVLVGLLVRRTRGEGPTPEAIETDAENTAIPTAEAADIDELPSVRLVWRIVARTVAPQQWRTRAPAEIEHRAIERGYPAEPTRELTALFRELEYGDRSPSRAARERASDAYRELEDALQGSPSIDDLQELSTTDDVPEADRS